MERKPGVFYAVGVGPGDGELLTIKAVRVLERCAVIAAPRTRGGGTRALDVVRQTVALEGKRVLFLPFAMARRGGEEDYDAAAETVAAELAAGRDVAMPALGDASIYASCACLAQRLAARGFETVTVPGVPSFCAVAAALHISLTAPDAPLHILPAGADGLDDALDLPGTKVLMKSGRQLGAVLDALREKGLLQKAAAVQDCGTPEERVCRNLAELSPEAGYFTTIVVKE